MVIFHFFSSLRNFKYYTYSTENTALDVGSNDYVLTADSTTTTGLAWLDADSIKHKVALVIACGDEILETK